MSDKNIQLAPHINTGLVIEIRETDYEFGGYTQIEHEERVTTGDWSPFLPDEERQSGRFDTFGCVSFSAMNSVETQINWMMANDLLTDETIAFLKDNQYIGEDGKLNCSDRFTVKMSGTVPGRGNSFQSVWDSIREDGVVPEVAWPNNLENISVDEYYSEIPQAVKDLGKKFLQYFEAAYEKVSKGDIKKALHHAPIQIGTATCNPWAGGVIPMCSELPNHATMVYKVDGVYYDFDQYQPFEKKLAGNYRIPFAYKCVVSPIQSVGNGKKTVTKSGGFLEWLIKIFS